MKIRLLAFLLLLAALLSICACSKDSTFSIRFIDVGQGDAALVECDGHYMLIDGGNKDAGDKVYDTLYDERVSCLDILAVSHFHEDHVAGLPKILTYVSEVGKTICVTESSDLKCFPEFEHRLRNIGSKITVPSVGEKYTLGSAVVEVVDAGDGKKNNFSKTNSNDSLVLLITYGDTSFLFTGDIEGAAQARISSKFQNDYDEPFKIDLMKMPHHGAYSYALYHFLRTFMPDHVIISVGANNNHHHPNQNALDLLDSKTWKPKVYRTDQDGDIVVKSNGKEILVETEK